MNSLFDLPAASIPSAPGNAADTPADATSLGPVSKPRDPASDPTLGQGYDPADSTDPVPDAGYSAG